MLNFSAPFSPFYSINPPNRHTPPLPTCLPYWPFVWKSKVSKPQCIRLTFFHVYLTISCLFLLCNLLPWLTALPRRIQTFFFTLAARLGTARSADSRMCLKISSSCPAFEASLNPRLFHSSAAQGSKVPHAEKLSFCH